MGRQQVTQGRMAREGCSATMTVGGLVVSYLAWALAQQRQWSLGFVSWSPSCLEKWSQNYLGGNRLTSRFGPGEQQIRLPPSLLDPSSCY
ncbi:unnamed protein product [Linum trigynum]|uniref:Uncharacterized protein n=1 Tax=Linum trigynum TaxID=586398 RepID=A0AAV2DUP3_9ROSI